VPIILFDDVWTTGSTVKEATKILKEEGTKRVNCLTLTS
jgi:predicted amidophosphoribosyltransferase